MSDKRIVQKKLFGLYQEHVIFLDGVKQDVGIGHNEYVRRLLDKEIKKARKVKPKK